MIRSTAPCPRPRPEKHREPMKALRNARIWRTSHGKSNDSVSSSPACPPSSTPAQRKAPPPRPLPPPHRSRRPVLREPHRAPPRNRRTCRRSRRTRPRNSRRTRGCSPRSRCFPEQRGRRPPRTLPFLRPRRRIPLEGLHSPPHRRREKPASPAWAPTRSRSPPHSSSSSQAPVSSPCSGTRSPMPRKSDSSDSSPSSSRSQEPCSRGCPARNRAIGGARFPPRRSWAWAEGSASSRSSELRSSVFS